MVELVQSVFVVVELMKNNSTSNAVAISKEAVASKNKDDLFIAVDFVQVVSFGNFDS